MTERSPFPRRLEAQRKGAATYDFLGEMVYRPQRNVAAPDVLRLEFTAPTAHRSSCALVPWHAWRAAEKRQALSCWLHLASICGENTHTDTKINSKIPAFGRYFSASAGVAERPASSMRGSAVRGIRGCGSMGFHFPFIILSCCWNTFI